MKYPANNTAHEVTATAKASKSVPEKFLPKKNMITQINRYSQDPERMFHKAVRREKPCTFRHKVFFTPFRDIFILGILTSDKKYSSIY